MKITFDEYEPHEFVLHKFVREILKDKDVIYNLTIHKGIKPDFKSVKISNHRESDLDSINLKIRNLEDVDGKFRDFYLKIELNTEYEAYLYQMIELKRNLREALLELDKISISNLSPVYWNSLVFPTIYIIPFYKKDEKRIPGIISLHEIISLYDLNHLKEPFKFFYGENHDFKPSKNEKLLEIDEKRSRLNIDYVITGTILTQLKEILSEIEIQNLKKLARNYFLQSNKENGYSVILATILKKHYPLIYENIHLLNYHIVLELNQFMDKEDLIGIYKHPLSTFKTKRKIEQILKKENRNVV